MKVNRLYPKSNHITNTKNKLLKKKSYSNHKFDNIMSINPLWLPGIGGKRKIKKLRALWYVKNSHNIVNNVSQANSVVEFVIYCLYR